MIEFTDDIKVVVRDNPCDMEEEVYIMARRPDGKMVFKVGEKGFLEDGMVIPLGGSRNIQPTIRLTKDTLQKLFDALQQRGMKPVSQSFVEGKLQATEKHLEDMRTLALLEVKPIVAGRPLSDEDIARL